MTDLQTLLKIKSDAIEEENKLAQSLYKTSVDRIKVLEKQVEILCKNTLRCPDSNSYKDGYHTYSDCCLNNDCQECWQDWSLKEAEKAVKDDTN